MKLINFKENIIEEEIIYEYKTQPMLTPEGMRFEKKVKTDVILDKIIKQRNIFIAPNKIEKMVAVGKSFYINDIIVDEETFERVKKELESYDK